jgi:hypothetical protein
MFLLLPLLLFCSCWCKLLHCLTYSQLSRLCIQGCRCS